MSRFLITGASGFLGSLTAAGLLAEGHDVVLAVRPHHTSDSLLATLATAWPRDASIAPPSTIQRIGIPPDPRDALADLDTYDIDEIVHCAGCMAYFDAAKLDAGNLHLTAAWLDIASHLGVRRFTFVSTAFSCGYVPGRIPEALHEEPSSDPTLYTASKRATERLVDEHPVPSLILRPPVVIGHSQDGQYYGQRYGLYQFWWAASRFLCRSYRSSLHLIAPDTPVELLHSDAFQAGMLGYLRTLDTGVVHLVCPSAPKVTMRDVCDLWVQHVSKPQTVHYYQCMGDTADVDLDVFERSWLEFTETNTEIGSREWPFERQRARTAEAAGVRMPQATQASVATCMHRFVESAGAITRFRKQLPDSVPRSAAIVEHGRDERGCVPPAEWTGGSENDILDLRGLPLDGACREVDLLRRSGHGVPAVKCFLDPADPQYSLFLAAMTARGIHVAS